MSTTKIDHDINAFRENIINTLNLKYDQDGFVQSVKRLTLWIKEQSFEIQAEKQEKKKSENFIGNWFSRSKNKSSSSQENYLKEIETLKTYISNQFIPNEFFFKEFKPPGQIIVDLEKIRGKQWIRHYGLIKGPLFSGYYLESKEQFHSKIQQVNVNNLKFMMVDSTNLHKYQRNLLQQVMSSVLRKQNFLSVVLKIESSQSYSLYCYIEDKSAMKNQNQNLYQIDKMVEDFNELFIEDEKKKKIEISDMNFVKVLLSEILVLPLQTLVSDFSIRVENDKATILKYSIQNQNAKKDPKQLFSHSNLKEHPSLRSPLFYFKTYLKEHSISIKDLDQQISNKELFSSFYHCLAIIIEFMQNDFMFQYEQRKIKISSLCFNLKVFSALWQNFHRTILLKGWLKQIVGSLKEKVTFAQIIGHFCPIFIELMITNFEKLEQYKQFFKQLDIESYLATSVKKKTLEKYKDMFVNIEEAFEQKQMRQKHRIYDEIFAPIIEQIDLNYCDNIECCYILHFVSKNKYFLVPNAHTLPQEWKDHIIWEKCIKKMKEQKLPFIDIDFDFLAFSVGVNTFEIDENCFERVQFSPEGEVEKNRLKQFIYLLKTKFSKNSSFMLTTLLQAAFKHRKYEFCRVLLRENARIQDFSEILKHEELLLENESIIKESLIEDMKIKSPRMHRLYQWQKMVLINLKQPFQNSIKVETIHYEQIYLPKRIFEDEKIINDLSRNDYMYDPNRQITRINCQNGQSYYIQRSTFPVLPHFYLTLFQNISLQDMLPYFTSFYHNNQIYQVIEHLPGATTWQSILSNHSENQVFSMTNPSLVSESIINSLALLPGKISLKDMIIKSSEQIASDQIFMINWNSFYRKDFYHKMGNNTVLGCKNSLFILDMMNKVISPSIVQKYSNFEPKKIIDSISTFAELVDKIKQKNKDKSIPNKQQLGIIFEKEFLFKFAERIAKMMRILKKQKSVTHMKLLETINPDVASYYEQIINSEATLIKREEHLLDNMYKKSFLNTCNLIEFFGSFRNIQEQENQFPQHYYKFCFEGPTENLANLSKQTKKLTAYEKKIPKNLNKFNPETFQYYIQEVDASELTGPEKQQLFNLIKERSTQYTKNENKNAEPLRRVSFKNVQVIKEKFTQNFSYERTQQVKIEECKIGDYELGNFFKILDNVTLINAKNIKGLKYIGGQNSVFGKTLEIKHLKTMIVQQCDDLLGIEVKCDILENVKLKSNKVLENVYFKSRNLKNIYTSKNINLNFSNLAVYILMGINVFACKVSCHGQLTKLSSQNYQIYLLKILKHIFDIFENQTTQVNILATLSKLNKVDLDNIFKGVVNISANISALTSVFKGYGTEIEDKVLLRLIKVFFSNPNFNTFSVHPLTSTPFSKPQRIFKLMVLSLQEVKNAGSIKQLIIPRPLTNFMEGFTRVCGLLKFEKNLFLEFEDIEEENNEEKIRFLYFLVDKRQIQKISLRIKTSILSKKFFHLFSEVNKTNKIKEVSIDGSEFKNSVEMRSFSLRELKLKNCSFEDYSFLNQIQQITTLSLKNNKSKKEKDSFIEYIQKNTNLVNLQISEQKSLSEYFDRFCTLLTKLPKLKTLTLNNNNLKSENLKMLDGVINKTKLSELVLYDFYNIEEFQFSAFLRNTINLKSLKIQFFKQAHLSEFFKALGGNKSIINFHLNTTFQIGSNILSPLINNHTLEIFTSKKLLPMWLRNQIKANGKQKSDVFEVQQCLGSNQTLKTNDYFRIGLSLDGGGVRGLLLATELQYLTSRVGYPLHQIFDCVGGTSIGGILALTGTGSLNQKNPVCVPFDMMNIFQKYGGQIFKKTNMTQIRSLFDTKYTVQSFEALLKNYFKDSRLSDVLPETSVIVTAVNRLDNKDLIFRSTEALLNRDKDFYMRDVARATSAAPTYFPSAEIKNIPATKKFSLIDGGVGMNNPSKLVIDEIKKISANLGNESNYFLLSLGTGKLKSEVIPTSAGIKDLAPIIDSFTISASNFTQRDLQQNYKGHFLRVSPTINLTTKEGQLDNTQDSVLKIYKETAEEAARKYFENTVIFGKYRNYNLIEWLRENTEKKLEI